MSTPIEIVRRYLSQALGGREPSVADELIGSDALRTRHDVFLAAFPDLSVTPHLVVGAGDFVAVHLSGRASHLGQFQGLPPTGRTWTASCTAIYRVVDERIVDFWVNWDLLAILEQIGGVRRAEPSMA